jgi:spermidine/putrescine transport system substrate-binding protein
MAKPGPRILVPRLIAPRLAATLNRRSFLALSGATALGAFLAACGGDDDDSGSGGTSDGGDVDRSINLYTWAEYDDPDLIASWGNVTVDIYGSNEEAIQKLVAAQGSSGYDIVVPTGAYIPQMSSEGLLEELDLDRLPNFANLDTPYTDQPWDPGNKYSVCKDWGTTGWIYDNSVITTPIATWSDFIAAAQGPASGRTSVLDTAAEMAGIYFWANGIVWTTEDTADLDACEDFLVNDIAQHISAFDSYPGISLTQGNYALSQVWNGDARQGFLAVEDAGDDPTRYTWGIGSPATEIWMDTWAIVKNAPNLDGAYDFLNFILDPQNSITDLVYHGYNTGMKDIANLLPSDLQYSDMIFFSDEEVATMEPTEVNSAQDRLVDIYNQVKARAGA